MMSTEEQTAAMYFKNAVFFTVLYLWSVSSLLTSFPFCIVSPQPLLQLNLYGILCQIKPAS